MTRPLLLCLAILPAALALGQTNPPVPPTQSVTINSKGLDVRSVLHDVFTQTNHNYVLEPNVRFVLYLSVKDVEFEEGLQIVCKLANLEYEIQNGIYYVGPKKTQPAKAPPKVIMSANETPVPPPAPKVGTLPTTVLNKRITTRLSRTPFPMVVEALCKQSGVTIELDPSLAKWKLDAFFIGSSLKYALDNIAKAGGLEYRFTNRLSIEIVNPQAATATENKVAVYRD